MNSLFFYPRFALTNIKNNRRFFVPYILTGIGCAAMLYIMIFIQTNKGTEMLPGAASMKLLLSFGTVIIAIFSAIFLLYTNGFLMKRRKKELGLFNILGMEKKHIAKIQFFETLFVSLCSIVLGLACGVLFSKLVMLLLFKIVRFPVQFGFEISVYGIWVTALVFLAIYFLTLLVNLMKTGRLDPVELLREGSAGQREPKTKWLITLIGVLSLGGGYAIAVFTKSPLSALALFFLAVLLVIIGTYCLFTSGSIAMLKILRRNKKYYYKTKHFTSVSGMLYRMKQNAVGLANICILSTMVLVMVSTTAALYVGMQDVLVRMFPSDIQITISNPAAGDIDSAKKTADAIFADNGRAVKSESYYSELSLVMLEKDGAFVPSGDDYSMANGHQFTFITAEDYSRLTGSQVTLGQGQVLEYSESKNLSDSFSVMGQTFSVKEHLGSFPAGAASNVYLMSLHCVVVRDESVLENICAAQRDAYGEDNASSINGHVIFDIDGTDQQKTDCYTAIQSAVNGQFNGDQTSRASVDCRAAAADGFNTFYGGFLFLGIFLGLLFLMATILIIYYKQVTEGYEDKERFAIMQKVGMSHREVKKTIHSQVLTVFFLPIAVACVHIVFAFNIIKRLLYLLSLTNVPLFIWCTVGTVAVFTVFYAVVYAVTAKVYYKIVSA